MKRLGVLGLLLGITLFGCSKATPLQPTSKALSLDRAQQTAPAAARSNPGQPEYEPAYYDGRVYTINAIEVPNVAPEKALADFYEVVYPKGWDSPPLNLDHPQCNPCDHEGNGIDPSDYHDHVLDSVPSSPGHGEYRALWGVYVVAPAYTGDTKHDDALSVAYAAQLPAKSEEEVQALLDAHLGDGSPLAIKIDTDFYFLCAVVDPHAAPK